MGCYHSKSFEPDSFLTTVDIPMINIAPTTYKQMSDDELQIKLSRYQDADLMELHELMLEKRLREARRSHETHLHMYRANYYFAGSRPRTAVLRNDL